MDPRQAMQVCEDPSWVLGQAVELSDVEQWSWQVDDLKMHPDPEYLSSCPESRPHLLPPLFFSKSFAAQALWRVDSKVDDHLSPRHSGWPASPSILFSRPSKSASRLSTNTVSRCSLPNLCI